ncbi:MAG: hypothetical protein QG670_1101 [Thermoproteota archaeon]|nr:hypothetical protein [Thermoproteota archaeon]
MTDRYDVTIAYRIYPKFGRQAFVLPSWKKYDLAMVCLKSLLKALERINYKLYAILDGCPAEYKELFSKLVDSDHLKIVELPGNGNAATFLEQMRLLKDQHESEIVYFAEDDYLYTEKAMLEMLEMIEESDVDFVTPYDHTDYYLAPSIHSYRSKIVFKSRHWRTVSSTTMTFLTKKPILEKVVKYLSLYPRAGDYGMWLMMTKMRKTHFSFRRTAYLYKLAGMRLVVGKPFKLWSPMPSLATHMVESMMSLGVDWNEIIGRYSLTEPR